MDVSGRNGSVGNLVLGALEKLTYKDDYLMGEMRHKLKLALNRTFPAVQPRDLLCSRKMDLVISERRRVINSA